MFTWIIVIVNLINAHAKEGSVQGYSNYSLQKHVFEKYNGSCSKCHNIPCSCVSKDGSQKISELNVIYPKEIIEAIKKSQTELSAEIQKVFASSEGQEFVVSIKKLIDSADITETRVRTFVERLILDPMHKKWYDNIRASGIAESAIVSGLTVLVQNMFH